MLAVIKRIWASIIEYFLPKVPPPDYASVLDWKEIANIRRRRERRAVENYDKTDSCHKWYLISTHWLNAWLDFVYHDGDPPGPIDMSTLMVDGRVWCKLHRSKHYRGLNQQTWEYFTEIYGCEGSPIVRHAVMIYGPPYKSKFSYSADELKFIERVIKKRYKSKPWKPTKCECQSILCAYHELQKT